MTTARKSRNHRMHRLLRLCRAAAGVGPENSSNTDNTVIGYSYSAHGELETVSIPGEGNISVNQYKWTAPEKVTLPGGATQDKTYDGLLNLASLKIRTPGQQTVLELANSYGKVQELKTVTRTDTANNNGASTSKSAAYQYDSETRLTQATTSAGGLFGNDTEAFTLDAVGNRIAHSRVAGAWVYDANNRLTKLGNTQGGTCGQGATCFTYDAQGNQTQKTDATGKTTQYRYDTQNRLIAVSTTINGASQLVAQYGYDPLDRRLWKEQYRDMAGNPLAQAKRSYYLYADEGLIAEASQDISLNADSSVTSSQTPVITTQYGPRPDSEFTTGLLFIKTKNTNGQDTVAYYHHDHLDTPIQATDKAGNIVWAASYNAFGQASIITPQATADKPTITSNLRLPGQYEDVETGLHYNWHRYYDAQIGRYVTSDPIGWLGGDNQYRYANADPKNRRDPRGEYVWIIVGGVIGAAISGYQKALDPCASGKDIALAMAGGAFSGALGAFVPITSMGLGRAILNGAAAGYLGSQGSNVISSGFSMQGMPGNHGAAMTSAFMGGFGGAAGNVTGLGVALLNVRYGLSASKSLATGDRVGTAAGVLAGTSDSAIQFSAPNVDPCSCKK